MFVTRDGFKGSLLLREVETEFEAFAEMRRYNEVNHIKTDTTSVQWVEAEKNHLGKIVPRHKRVKMIKGKGRYSSHPEPISAFCIYYGKTEFLKLSDIGDDDKVKAYFEDLEERKKKAGVG